MVQWIPLLYVRVSYQGWQTPDFYAAVDSGSSYCLFRSSIGRHLGIPVEAGFAEVTLGVENGFESMAYFHPIELQVESEWTLPIRAGFVEGLAFPGILGMAGFFEHFRVTFDHGVEPPVLEIHRITR